ADDAPETVLTKLEAEEHRALADTAASLDVAALTGAADAIVSARRTVVAAIGACGLVAVDLAPTLGRVGLISRPAPAGHMAQTLAVRMSPEDLLVIVSASGETTDMVEPLVAAQQAGVPTVAITMRPRSSVTSADQVLIGVAARETGMRSAAMSSRIGQFFVVDALFTLVFQRRFDEAEAAIDTSHWQLATRRPGKTTT